MSTPRRPSVAAGAARASSERARRTATPLLGEPASHLRVVQPDELAPEPPFAAHPSARPSAPGKPGLKEFVAGVRAVAHRAAGPLGMSRDEAEAKAAEAVAFIRRRLTGDYAVDNYGYDADFAEHILYPLLRPLFYTWFRVEVRGLENIPSTGGALLVANHSGTVAVDSLMTQVAIHDKHPAHRQLRELGADLVFGTPGLGSIARKGGATLATNPDAERLLTSGELVGVWPEGFKGVGKPVNERYTLHRFGRGGFVAAAIRTGVPIIPCAIIGAEEIYPMIANLKGLANLVGLPYFPVTPTFPWLGPLGMIPLPSKWIIEFGPPVDTGAFDPKAADDPMIVFDLTDRVRETIQQTVYGLLASRRSVFH